MELCWAYCAVSSSPQESSLESQREWAQAVAKANGWKISRTFSGVASGKLGTRTILEKLLRELRETPAKERPKYVLTIRLDRLARGTGIEGIAALAEIKKLGTQLYTREDGFVKIERASDAILPTIRSIVSALEGEVRSDRVRAGQQRRLAAGKHLGAVVYGCVLVDGKPVAFEPEAAIVRELFKLAAEGWGLERIGGHLRPKAPPKLLGNGTTRALTWGPTTVRSILRSNVVRQVVVDARTATAADAARAENFRFRPTGEWEWPLRGAIRCTCGHRLTGHATGNKPHRVRYYRCRAHPYDDRPAGNRRPGYRADALEAAFVDVLKRLAANTDRPIPAPSAAAHKRLNEREAAVRQHLVRCDRRRRRACELAEDGAYSAVELRERLDRIDGERRALQGELEEIAGTRRQHDVAADQQTTLRDELSRLPRRWPTLPIQDRQAVARAVSAYVGGLYADPKRPGKLLAGRRVAFGQKSKIRNNCRCNRKSSIR